jgi:threonine/homoserine/homoserine lactone efflux protein
MTLTPLLQGFVVGLLTCAPLGPIGLLAARRTLTGGRLAGFCSLIGASMADGVYCALVGFGVQAVSSLVSRQETLIRVAAGLVVAGVGVRVFLARPVKVSPAPTMRGLLEAFTSTFLLVLSNPLHTLIFAAAFTGLGIGGWGVDTIPTSFLVVGVFLGSASWSPLLASGVTRFDLEKNPRRMHSLNRVCGTLIGIFGLGLGLVAWLT